jgi:hypothetical protein
MLNSGKKIALCATKKLNILTLVLSEIKFLNEAKNHTFTVRLANLGCRSENNAERIQSKIDKMKVTTSCSNNQVL